MIDTQPSSKRAEASRQNGRKSRGPSSPEGRHRSRMNSLKHGLRAEVIDVLPDEDAGAYRAHLDRWIAQVEPADEIERTLVERAARLAWQLKRADRAIDSRGVELKAARADRIDEEADAVVEIGRRLFDEDPAPARSFAACGGYYEAAPSQPVGDFNESARLVRGLESTALGCGWLLDRWAEMREALEDGRGWGSEQRTRVFRLLGLRLDEMWEDGRALMILCSDTKGPAGEGASGGASDSDGPGRSGAGAGPGGRAGEDWSDLLEMIAEEEARLEGVLEHRLALREATATVEDVDGSEMGELLRRYQATSDRALLKVLDSLRQLRRESGSAVTKAGRVAKAKAKAQARPEGEGVSALAVEIAEMLEAFAATGATASGAAAPELMPAEMSAPAPNEPNGPAGGPVPEPNDPEPPTADVPAAGSECESHGPMSAPNEPERPSIWVPAAPNEPDAPEEGTVRAGSAITAVLIGLLALLLGGGLAAAGARTRGVGVRESTMPRPAAVASVERPDPNRVAPTLRARHLPRLYLGRHSRTGSGRA